MQSVLLVIHLLVVLALVGVVLLQRSEGGGLGMSGGGGGVQGFLTGRGQANALTRATAILAALFFILSIALSVLAGMNRKQVSPLDGLAPLPGTSAPATPGAPGIPAPAGGNLLDQLRQMDTPSAQPPRPATPVAPAP